MPPKRAARHGNKALPFPAPNPLEECTFQLISDIRLELRQEHFTRTVVQPTADFLVICGDTSPIRYDTGFLFWLGVQCSNFKHVFIVAGNHEHFDPRPGAPQTVTVAQRETLFKTWENDPRMGGKLTVLEQSSYDMSLVRTPDFAYEDCYAVHVIGCTLWSNINAAADQGVGDGAKIPGNNDAAHLARYTASLAWLTAEVARIRAAHPTHKILIATHHAPMIRGTSFPGEDGVGPRWTNFQSDILGGLGIAGLGEGDVWAFGHTHYSVDTFQDEVRVIANQRGGPFRETRAATLRSGYEPNLTFTI